MHKKVCNTQISLFWEKYIAKSKRYKVSEKSVGCYVRHADDVY